MVNSKDIGELHIVLQRAYKELIKRMDKIGYNNVSVSSTYRSNDYQDYLYAQGRTREGSIVTNAKGGESIHNYRLAFDIYKNIKGGEYSDNNFFIKAGKIWEEMGGVWGGSWSNFPDKPHFEFTNGLTVKQLQQGKQVGKDVKMLWETSSEEKEVEVEMRYNNLNEIPSWAKPTIQKLIDKQLLKGNDGGEKGLDLSLDMLRIFVINDRSGLYG